MNTKSLILRLAGEHSLTIAEYERLVSESGGDDDALLAELAVEARKKIYGNSVYVRGLIEISNICKNITSG